MKPFTSGSIGHIAETPFILLYYDVSHQPVSLLWFTDGAFTQLETTLVMKTHANCYCCVKLCNQCQVGTCNCFCTATSVVTMQ